jgi:thymidylate kinase
MVILPVRVWGSVSGLGDIDSGQLEASSATLDRKKDQEGVSLPKLPAFSLDSILSSSRIIIIEGISGSGKDTFQKYLKSKLRNRHVYDYSEGDLLLSWNQRPIKDIFKLQVRLMKNFIDYAADIIAEDVAAVFLLNRFHLSTYTMGVTEQPMLQREYNMILKRLQRLPTHVFILQLMEGEIESRSLHPERGAPWQSFKEHILKREGFQDFVKRNVLLQNAMIETAIRQHIPFSILRLPSAPNAVITRGRSSSAKIAKDTRLNSPTFNSLQRRHRDEDVM